MCCCTPRSMLFTLCFLEVYSSIKTCTTWEKSQRVFVWLGRGWERGWSAWPRRQLKQEPSSGQTDKESKSVGQMEHAASGDQGSHHSLLPRGLAHPYPILAHIWSLFWYAAKSLVEIRDCSCPAVHGIRTKIAAPIRSQQHMPGLHGSALDSHLITDVRGCVIKVPYMVARDQWKWLSPRHCPLQNQVLDAQSSIWSTF